MRNIVTGQLFPEEVFNSMINCEDTGKTMYKDFVMQRLQSDSEVGVFEPLKKASIKTCKATNKNRKVKVHDKIVELRSNCNLFARCALLKDKRNIDMKKVVGDYELMTVPRSLMKPDGTLLSGHVGKADLATEVIKEYAGSATEALLLNPESNTCAVIDAMHIVNTFNPKPTSIKTGDDLAKHFSKSIDTRSQGASAVIIVFDTYRDVSLKSATRDDRLAGKRSLKKVPRRFNIESETNIEKVSMSELLATNETKRSLTQFLMKTSEEHLSRRNVTYMVAGNNTTISSFRDDVIVNNHEEADTLIISCLCILSPLDMVVIVHSADTDVFVLLLKHHEAIPCKNIYMKLVCGFVNITSLHQSMGSVFATALLSLHALTGCDTTGKFAGVSKAFWVRRFITERNNEERVRSLASFALDIITSDIIVQFGSFVCKAYKFPRSTKKIPENQIYDLSSTRYALFLKSNAEGEKLPPSLGAFKKHVDRAYFQLRVWYHAHLSVIDTLDPLQYGWEKDGESYSPATTDDPIAPKAVLEMASCKSCKLCSDRKCACKVANVPCTDFCGCGEFCENTDSMLPANVMEDEEDEVDN